MRQYWLTASVLCLSLLGFVSIQAAYARMDAMQLRLLEPYSQDLRWDNVESAPAWINGVKPEYHDDWEMNRVRLAPKQQVTVFLPAYESLRLYHPKQTVDNKELDIYASSGTGLAVKQNLQQSSDGHSLILSPHSATPLLIHITRKCCRAGDVDAALFVSRKVPLGEIAPYRKPLWFSGQWCWLGQEPFTLPDLYKQLPAQQKKSLELVGPARVTIKNRLHYEQYAGDLAQDYRIHYWLDDDKAQELDFSTSVETGRVITVNGSIEVVGREEQAYLEIPAGRHRLVLQADRPLFVQLLAQTEHDYLFRSLNNPRLPVESIRNQGLLTTTELDQQAQTAKRIAQDNSRKEGGQVASNLLREAALKREDYPAGLTEAEHLRTTRSFYRDLLPSKKADPGTQFMAYFLTETLQPINRPSRDTLLADQHLAEALKRASQAYFTPLTKVGSAGANEYTLPEQQTDGFLRLIIDKRDCSSGFLHIQIDQQMTKDLWLRCQPDLESEAFTRSLAETALMRLQQKPDSFNVSLEALFSTYSEPARVIATAVYEISLPKSTRTIKLWQVSKPIKPVNVAVQYRASKVFLLSEQSYLARLRDSSGKHTFAQMIDNALGTNDNLNQKSSTLSAVEQQLVNEWLPLQRLLQAEYRLYKSSVSSYPATQAVLTVDQQVIDNETALSKSSEAQQNWLEALEHWGKVVNYSEGLKRQQAQLHQAHVLTKMGEDYLAENLRRYLSLFADASVAEQAIVELSDGYQAQNNNAAFLTLASAISIQRPTVAHNYLLLNALLKNGEYRFALLLGLTLGEQLPLDGLLAAAYQLEWWQTYQWLQDKLPPDQRAFWLGLKSQRNGDYNAALKAWSGVKLKPWHDYLQQGLLLRDRLTQITGQNAQTLYGQWSTWQQQHPGTKTWQNALWHVKDYAGSDTYYAVERDVYAQAVKGTLQRPVVLGIMGPVTLNLQIRPLHPTGQPDVAFDGWLQIIDNDVPYRYPYTNNLTSQGLKVTGADNLQVGNVVNLVYQVGQGWHEIKLNSEQAPLSIGIQEQRPELPLSVLPPLKTDTFAEMGFISRSHNTHPANK
ncbi:MAG: hypothetical protein ABL884_02745 [Methyloglobulus sp.]